MRRSPKHSVKLDQATQESIGHHLRAMYADLVRQPLPEKLLLTLRSIQDAEEAAHRPSQRVRKAA
jgi:hypothetical protein